MRMGEGEGGAMAEYLPQVYERFGAEYSEVMGAYRKPGRAGCTLPGPCQRGNAA